MQGELALALCACWVWSARTQPASPDRAQQRASPGI